MSARLRKPRPGVCRVCGCTDEAGCLEGCSWADAEHTLCTSLVCQLVEVLGLAAEYLTTIKAEPLAGECRRALRRARKEARW